MNKKILMFIPIVGSYWVIQANTKLSRYAHLYQVFSFFALGLLLRVIF